MTNSEVKHVMTISVCLKKPIETQRHDLCLAGTRRIKSLTIKNIFVNSMHGLRQMKMTSLIVADVYTIQSKSDALAYCLKVNIEH